MRDNRQTAAQRGYGARWRNARNDFLKRHPLCQICEQQGYTKPAEVVDHINPAQNHPELFWDESNWQALCRWHHETWKKRQEQGSVTLGVDESGEPLSVDHHWREGGGGSDH